MKNKIWTLVLALILIFSLAGCDSGEKTDTSKEGQVSQVEKEKDTDEGKEEEKVNNGQSKEEEKEEKTVKVYFSDNQATKLVEKEIKVTLDKDKPLEEVVIEKLKDDSKDPELFNAVNEKIKIKSVTVKDKTANVDISSENLSGGSTEEVFLIDSIVSSLTSLDNIEKVQFLVDGKKVDTLMGHMEVAEPFTKKDVTTNIIKAQ
ncbi:spore germination protein-like protein [Gottschalkia acidurici 9a]|uniref:Spore germination protein-like protein n=1 Tax=Gottschalkia acidurici (strain ATCC 7906 / DSM 604 / BCRC 14475 / CIP 104303 / KCTC 5404 / NCIMB 10678 / 9a) TaxID=1128398 RepID=K0AZF1_GOTA9|nr:GerMN domain-containing protein [Gottschalkia acidurici]AFS78085.1 spore germination protein-like protein [Gottschalkia acidurici 9a]